MIKGFLLGAVVAKECKLPELERSDVEWDCTEKDSCWTKNSLLRSKLTVS